MCSYYLMTRAADHGLRHEVTAVLDAAASCGLTAIRTWAFCDGDEWNALQPKAGRWSAMKSPKPNALPKIKAERISLESASGCTP